MFGRENIGGWRKEIKVKQKIGKYNFDKLISDHQVHQWFLLPKFLTMQYTSLHSQQSNNPQK